MSVIKKPKISVHSSAGAYRKINEDNFFINGIINEHSLDLIKYEVNSSYPCLICLYDGMGGLANGEIASLAAAKLSSSFYEKIQCDYIDSNDLCLFYHNINNALNNYKRRYLMDFGTTAAIVYLNNEKIIVSNIGDTRIYTYKDKQLFIASIDHNDCAISMSNNIQYSSRLSQYLGYSDREFYIEPYVKTLINDYSKGDYLLICSDGVSSNISDDELRRIFKEKHRNYSKTIVDTALKNGSKDNLTAIVFEFA